MMKQHKKTLEAVNPFTLQRLAYLENAYEKEEVEILNGIGSLKFKLPRDDPKNDHLQPFYFVKSFNGQYYRIIEIKETIEDGGKQAYSYACEHCLATLCDNMLADWHQRDNKTTRQNIEYVLSHQKTVRWKLGVCEFNKTFSYGWQDENCLNAMWSITEVFLEEYMWDVDMTSYPWTVNLRVLNIATPSYYIRAGRNLLKAERATDLKQMCTRLYVYGMGEGVNRVTIAPVNGGKTYLEAPQAYIDRYGLIEAYLVDREFETPLELMQHGQKILNALREPRLTRKFDLAELYELTQSKMDKATVGETARFTEDMTDNYLIKTTRNLDKQGDLKIDIANSPEDIVGALNDLAARQRIEMTYAQGATQIYAVHGQGDCTTDVPFTVNFYIPPEARNVNYVRLKYRLEPFRSYTEISTHDGGGTTRTSTGNGGVSSSTGMSNATIQIAPTLNYVTSDRSTASVNTAYIGASTVSGTTGASSASTTEGASPGTSSSSGTTGSSSPGTGSASVGVSGTTSTVGGTGSHNHTFGWSGSHSHTVNSHTHSGPSHSHTVNSHSHAMGHTHNISISTGYTFGLHGHSDSHTHGYSHYHELPQHSHSFAIGDHTHSVTIPSHSHTLTQGIFRHGSPTGGDLKIRGVKVASVSTSDELDITQYLATDGGRIPRGSWIEVSILPNDLAYATIDLVVQTFIQSRGGAHY